MGGRFSSRLRKSPAQSYKMNLELLKKLVKLANNNPNEHEANSAARRVCKLIEDNEFKFVPDVVKAEVKQPAPGTWQGFTRNPKDYEDFIKGWWRQQNQSYKHSYDEEINPPEKPKRKLICTICKQEKETIFQGQPYLFVCINCN